MALKAGTTTDLTGSMASAMIEAFRQEYPRVIGGQAPAANEQMELLFVAIAQGVVKHLATHVNSLIVTTSGPSNAHTGTVSGVVTEGTLY